MEYKHIICPIDGSEISDVALKHAAYLSKTSGAQLTVLHVVEKWYRAAGMVTNSEEWSTIHEDWLSKGRELLEATANRLRDEGLHNIETVLREGDASHEIVAISVEHRADLIVMATHRYSPMGKLFMGSVIDRVTKKSPCPILWVF
ncbi:MAG: universal stress protein [Deltaproteobacteria bacterium]|nr:universal stress protein [Deltaproteobacteria bacterium]